jgi:hypothetical protein
MPIVSNTSPLLNLAIIGELELVREQFTRVFVPQAVVEEFRLGKHRPGSEALRQAVESKWLVVEDPSDKASSVRCGRTWTEENRKPLPWPKRKGPVAFYSTNGRAVAGPGI